MSDELPEGWVLAPLAALGALQNGPFGSLLHRSDYVKGGVPLINPANIVGGRLVPDLDITVGPDVLDRLSTYVMRPGDVVVGRRGEMGRAALVGGDRERWFCGTGCAYLRPSAATTGAFLAHWFGSPAVRSRLENDAVGATMSNLSTRILGNLEVGLPPLPEQRRIVAQIEALLADVNKAKERLDRVPLILKRFRQSVLAAACSGELTREWRKGRMLSDVGALLTEVARRRNEEVRVGRKPRELQDPEPLFDAPEDWGWTTLGHLARIVGGVTKGQKRRPGEHLRKVPYLRVANVQRGSLDLTEMKEIDATEAEIAELRLVPGDILFTEGGDRDKLGRGWVWSGELAECIHQNHIFRARLYLAKIDAMFVSWFGNVFGKAYFDHEASQTVNLASINITKLSGLPVPIPPSEEQTEIVRQVQKLLVLADTIERRLQAATARADNLPQAILSKAFSGELVPTEAELARAEGRTYETASQLLARATAVGAPGKGTPVSAKRGRARQVRAE